MRPFGMHRVAGLGDDLGHMDLLLRAPSHSDGPKP